MTERYWDPDGQRWVYPIDDLPPLPEPDGELAPTESFRATTLQEYARLAMAAERERCARLMDALLAEYEKNDDDNGWWFRDKAEDCIASIRGK